MKSDHGGLEQRADANTGDDLEDDGLPDDQLWAKVNEQSSSEGHEERAKPNGRADLACFADENSCAKGAYRQRQNKGEEKNTRDDCRASQDRLEVQSQVEIEGDEDEAVTASHSERCATGTRCKDADGDEWDFGKLPFPDHEDCQYENTGDDHAECVCRTPGVLMAGTTF